MSSPLSLLFLSPSLTLERRAGKNVNSYIIPSTFVYVEHTKNPKKLGFFPFPRFTLCSVMTQSDQNG